MILQRATTIVLASVCAIIATCSSVGQKQTSSNNGKAPQQLDFKLASGTYSCEQGQCIDIQRKTSTGKAIATRCSVTTQARACQNLKTARTA